MVRLVANRLAGIYVSVDDGGALGFRTHLSSSYYFLNQRAMEP